MLAHAHGSLPSAAMLHDSKPHLNNAENLRQLLWVCNGGEETEDAVCGGVRQQLQVVGRVLSSRRVTRMGKWEGALQVGVRGSKESTECELKWQRGKEGTGRQHWRKQTGPAPH